MTTPSLHLHWGICSTAVWGIFLFWMPYCWVGRAEVTQPALEHLPLPLLGVWPSDSLRVFLGSSETAAPLDIFLLAVTICHLFLVLTHNPKSLGYVWQFCCLQEPIEGTWCQSLLLPDFPAHCGSYVKNRNFRLSNFCSRKLYPCNSCSAGPFHTMCVCFRKLFLIFW